MAKPSRRAVDRPARGGGRASALRIGGAVGAVLIVAGGWYVWDSSRRQPPTREGAPSWSPDGREIVYYAEQPEGKADLFVMGRDGASVRRLTETPADEGAPAFSPDGRSIAYDTDRDGNFEIYVMDAGGHSPRRLTNHRARDLAPAWSPDSRQIVFMSDRDSRPEFDVYRMNADGTGVERLTPAGGSYWFPQYSPDGTRIAMHVWRDVHILDLQTKQLQRLTTDPLNGMYPTWSPDGRRLAFMSWRNGPTEIFTMNADGTDQQMLVSMPRGSAIDPRWSPDGRYLAFVSVPEETVQDRQSPEQERVIYTVELDSRRMRRLSR